MKKIMFNDRYGLTEAVLSGRKTQTRRVVPKSIFQSEYDIDEDKRKIWIEDMYGDWHDVRKSKYCFKVGEVVAIAQCYKDCGFDPNIPQIWTDKGVFIFDDCPISQLAGWNNKLFVLAALMPHHIRITNVRVERLQDITEEDCIKEGIYKDATACFNHCAYDYYKCINNCVVATRWYNTPREAYAVLIDRISGKGTWESNPYVFVYDFELVD